MSETDHHDPPASRTVNVRLPENQERGGLIGRNLIGLAVTRPAPTSLAVREVIALVRVLLVPISPAPIGPDPLEVARVTGQPVKPTGMVAGNTSGISQAVHGPVVVGVSALMVRGAVLVGPGLIGVNLLERGVVIPGHQRLKS
jgi:hypothetical protein